MYQVKRDMNGSVGGVTTIPGPIGNSQSPHWLVCQNPTRDLDWHATWHAVGCPICQELADSLLLERPDDANVKWLLNHMKNPDEVGR